LQIELTEENAQSLHSEVIGVSIINKSTSQTKKLVTLNVMKRFCMQAR